MKGVPVRLIIFLLFLAGIVWIQIFFSKSKNKCLGLILPLISFCFSLLMILNIAAFDSMSGLEVFGVIIITLLLANIPTIILMAIYIAFREKISIRDLE